MYIVLIKYINFLLKFIGLKLIRVLNDIQNQELNTLNQSWSQEGEDLILERYFKDKLNGFYVDVGAHDPFRFSNTYKFYLKSWTGINIDANPDKLSRFLKYRMKDVNLNIGISDNSSTLTFYRFELSELNTFDFDTYNDYKNSGFKIKDEITVSVRTLNQLLEEKNVNEIDFLNIDVEGFDLKVLRGLDLLKYKPEIILIEGRNDKEKNEIINFLKGEKYNLMAMTFNTMFFKRDF
jgi:FkbM family methyltransferase